MARIFHKFKSKIGLSIFALCLAFCLIGSSAGVLSVSNAQKRVAESTTNTEAEQIEQSATDNQGRTYWDYNANGSNVYDGSIQTFTAPITAKFMLEAWGASGGGSAGGYGAYSVSYVDLTAGNTVLILVGKAGGQGGNSYCGGGGGGTFFALGTAYASATPLCVAGGGAGGQCNNQVALATNNHGMATQASGLPTDNTTAPTVGYGGVKGIASSGGGFYGNGVTGRYGSYGYGFRQGGKGGEKTDSNAYGGYGGGGSTHGNCGGAPGGGGYTGGNAANSDHTGVLGGGGGSYYTGSYNGKSAKAIGGGGAIPSRTINSSATVSGKQGNGFARITQLNMPPQNNGAEPSNTKTRGTNVTHLLREIAKDADATNDTFTFADQNIYLA
ncbi:MAG: hypothetical protein HFK10_05345, partial [Clostridia bacterium]|nr:hypothetical protein [Clostridia bacterium]